MVTTTSLDSNPYLEIEIAYVKNLASVVQKSGISLNSVAGRNPRGEALAFIVNATWERNGKDSTVAIDKLIQEIHRLATENNKTAACKVSFMLYKETTALLDFKAEQLKPSLNNEEYKVFQAIHQLYLACKSQNPQKYAQGQVVSFAGVPNDLVPTWFRNIEVI